MPDSMYEAQIQARNHYGWSAVSEKFQFYTRAYGEFNQSINQSTYFPFTFLWLVAIDSLSFPVRCEQKLFHDRTRQAVLGTLLRISIAAQ